MSTLQSSRWAATPSEEETPMKAPVWQDSTSAGYFGGKPLPQPLSEDEELPIATPRAAGDSGAEKTESETKPEQEQEQEQQPPSIEVSEEEPIKDVPQEQKPADLVKPMPEVARLAPPKLRKRVSWRGKNCIISIPRLDYEALGLMRPMSSEDFQQRLKEFEDEGYDTRGFDLGHILPGNASSMHAKPIWPDEADMKEQTSIKESHNVKLPNLRLWADYMDALTEARLAALGVSLGDDEPAPLSAQEASRQGSGQFSPSLFSPPGSAASLGRPGMIRGHSHTMSMASPISPLNGPFGHMHRHSTFHGAFPGFVSPAQQQQDLQQRQTPIPGLGNFSPLTQNHLSRVGSPLQVTALRNELGGLRGPGSPLSNQMMPQSSQDYSRGMIEDQRRRQHGYSQSMQAPSMARNFSPQTGRLSAVPQYALPELPEDEEEEEEEEEGEDPLAYVAPVERQQINNQIAIPTPRGHRHNISEGLEREVLEAEQRRQPEDARPFGGFGQPAQQKPMVNGFNSQENEQQYPEEPTPPEEKDPLSGDFVVAESARGHRKTGTRANIAPPVAATAAPPVPKATSLRFNPTAEFQPGAAAFSFGAGAPQTSFAPPVVNSQPSAAAFSFGTGVAQPPSAGPVAQPQPSAAAFSFGAGTTQPDFSATSGHSRQKSSGHFNPAAITFEPGNPSTVPSSGFNFSSNGPAFVPDAPAYLPNSTGPGSSEENKIFGKVAIPEIVKPSKKSAAVPILVPVEMSRNGESGTEVEDSDGRTVRKNERQKRQRALGGDDGDEVPQFAEPTPLPILPTQPEELYPVAATPEASPKILPKLPTFKEIESEAIEALNAIAAENKQNAKSTDENAAPATVEQPAYQRGHKKSNSSLSAMAPPFVFHGTQASQEKISSPVKSPAKPVHVPQASISELEEGEILEDEPQSDAARPALGASKEHPGSRDSTASLSEPLRPHNLPESLDTSDDPRVEPTFDEIDAIMQQMNDVEASPNKDVLRSHSPNLLQPSNGVTYLPGWPRSDAPSPSPKRQQRLYQQQNDSSFTAHDRSDSGELHGMNGWPPQRINKDDEVPHSDWSGLLSPIDEDKLQSRSMFFDSHIDSIIGRVVDRRLQPLENSLRAIQSTVSKRARSTDQLTLKPRSSSIAESDADDEDDVNDTARNRPVSRGRDQKLSQIKAIVMEAIREQGPASGQSYHDIADLHSALADMKVSFARAASASLELEDIRLIVEEAVKRQPPAVMPAEKDESELSTRQFSEMQGRLDETLANALEDANHRQQAEAREADVRRMLKLAEEELKLLRESSQDDDARLHALEQERQELRHRAESAERAQEDADERCQSMEAEHEAMQATLEEYRTSSNKWRQEIEETKSERDELENAVGLLEQRLQSEQDAASRDKIELENTVSEFEQRLQYEQDAGKRDKAELEVTIAELELRLESERKAGKLAKSELENNLAELEQRLQNERWDGEREKAALASTVLELERHNQVAIEESKRDREELETTIAALERQFEDTQDSGNGMRRRLEKLHSDMATAAGQLASEKASWKNLEEEYIVRFEELEAQNNTYSRENAALEEEIRELRTVAAEATDAKLALDNLRSSKSSLDEMVRKQQAEIREQQVEIREQQALAARFERDYQDARESARAEIQRTRMSLETDVEAANHQVNIVRAQYDSELARVRAEYESEISRVRNELDNVRMDADTAKERHAIQLEAESDSKREALRKVNHDNSVALDKARHNYEAAVQDLKVQHSRALRHATEDKDRSEYFLNERLRLADAKLEHFQDRVVHLEERLEVTKSAAQAAAMSAQSKSTQAVTSNSRSTIPEKVSPQALRESILVLQEQLQERESRIEQLQNKVKVEGPEKIKERDTEIAWLRELLGVRSEELTELINALSRPTFDRETVRDTAIRIRANLQMEQQEKERFGQNGSLPGQALASLTSFATPKAASLFNKWRSSMESTTLKAQQSRAASAAASRSNTPSRPSVAARIPSSYKAGLMTPPATNLRSSPAPEATRSLPAPALGRTESRDQKESAPAEATSNAQGKQPMTDFTAAVEDPSTPPEEFTANEFDQDATDAHSQIPDFDDDPEPEADGDESLDDLDDNQPPAFRSLEEELDDEESTIAGGEEEGA